MTLPRCVEIPKDEFFAVYAEDEVQDPADLSEALTDYLSDKYGYCICEYGGWEIKKDTIFVFDIDWDDDYRDYLDELSELELDDTAYEYYKNAILDMHFGDKGDPGYDSYNAVINDARRTADQ